MFVPTSVSALPIPTDNYNKNEYSYNYNNKASRSSAHYPFESSDSLPRFMSLTDYDNRRHEIQGDDSDNSYYTHLFEAIVGEATSDPTQNSFQLGGCMEDINTHSPSSDLEDQNMSQLFDPKSYIATPTNHLNIENSIGINDSNQRYSAFSTQYDNGNEFHMNFTYPLEHGSFDDSHEDYAGLIHTEPRRSNRNVTIINEEAMYEEFLKDYDTVSLPKHKTSSTTDLNIRNAQPFSNDFPSTPPSQIGPANPTEKYAALSAFGIGEIAGRGDSRAGSSGNLPEHKPKFIIDSFPESSLLDCYANVNEGNAASLWNTDGQVPALTQDLNNSNIKTKDSKETDFIHKLQNKLNRYFSTAGYLDKVRFQEISYRFSKTYY